MRPAATKAPGSAVHTVLKSAAKLLRIGMLVALVLLAACASAPSGDDTGTAEGAPVIERFEVSPGGGLEQGGGEVTLSWTVTDADSVRIDPDLGAVDGTEAVTTVTESTSFTLTASNARGSTEATVIALVASDEPPGVDLLAFSAADQIDEALALGTIDEVTALRYKIFAVHGDKRLPPEYDAEGPIHGTPIMFELAQRFDGLTAEVKDEMRPFLLPPDLPESWYGTRSGSAQKADDNDAAAFPPLEGDLLVAGGRVRLKWQASFTESEKQFVRTVVGQALTYSYAQLTELMGRTPIGDGDDPDVYPVYVMGDASASGLGWTSPTSETAQGWRSHLTLNLYRIIIRTIDFPELLVLPSELASWVVAHELFHAIGATFEFEDICADEVLWLHESSATWAGNYVYPEFDYEHRFAGELLQIPDRPLDDSAAVTPVAHRYGGYLFHLFATERLGGPNLMREFWEESERQHVVPAIDEVLDGKLPEVWADVAVTNWNAGPVRLHSEWDDLDEGVATHTEAFTTVDVTLGGEPTRIIPVPVAEPGVNALAAQYVRIEFDDPSVRSLLFSNGFNYELGRGVPSDLIVEHEGDAFYVANEVFTEVRARNTQTRLLVKSQGQWSGPYDLTVVPFVAFCQDLAEESVEELVFIFINGNFETAKRAPVKPRGLQPSFLASNMACGAWVGTAGGSSTGSPAPGNPDLSYSEVTRVSLTELSFSREPVPMEELVRGWPATNLGTYLFSTYVGPSYWFELSEGKANWTETYASSDPAQSCEGSGSVDLDQAQLYGILGTYNHVLPNDPTYRGHFIDVGPLTELTYQVSCELGPGGTRRSNFSLGTFDDDTPPIESDGATILGSSERLTEAGIVNDLERWTWDLFAATESSAP